MVKSHGTNRRGIRDIEGTIKGFLMGKWSRRRKRQRRANKHIKGQKMGLTPTKRRRVVFLRDPGVEYPLLFMSIFVQGDPYCHKNFADMFVLSGCSKAKTPEEADLVVFTGGVDVNPKLYGEKAHETTRYNDERDKSDQALYEKCVMNGIPMMGVCRGAQFLHVMNGGKLFQHVDRHNTPHGMWDIKNNKFIQRISSVHHQMCEKNDKMEVLGEAKVSTQRWKNPTESNRGLTEDVEAFYYPDTGCLCFQGHPEYKSYEEYTAWCLNKVNEYVVENLAVVIRDKYHRLKADPGSLEIETEAKKENVCAA